MAAPVLAIEPAPALAPALAVDWFAPFATSDEDATRALYGVVGDPERRADADARIASAMEPPVAFRDAVRDDGLAGELALRARKRARFALLDRAIIPPPVFRVGWASKPAEERRPRAFDIPWLAFVNALRVRMMGARTVVAVDVRDTVWNPPGARPAALPARGGGGGAAYWIHIEANERGVAYLCRRADGWRGALAPHTDWTEFAVAHGARDDTATVRFAFYSRRFGAPMRVRTLSERRERLADGCGTVRALRSDDVFERAVPLVELAHDRSEFAEDEGAGAPGRASLLMALTKGVAGDALGVDFPRLDSLLWFGLACAYRRSPSAIPTAPKKPTVAPVRLMFPHYASDPDTRWDPVSGRVVCAHVAELLFVRLEAELQPENVVDRALGRMEPRCATETGVRLRAHVSVLGDRVWGVTDAAPGVQPLRFELRALDAKARTRRSARAAVAAGAPAAGPQKFVSMTFVPRAALL